MELYDSIFKRKSIRNFKQDKLNEDQCSSILEFAGNAAPLFPDIRYEISIVGPEDIKGIMGVKAPNYLLFFSEDKDGDYINAGFIMEQIDLFLSASGLGSCWLGMVKPKAAKQNSLNFKAVLAIGTPDEPLYRQNISEFNRKSSDQISQGEDPRLEAVRLAPSATNGQPWFFVCDDGDVKVYRKNHGAIKGMVFERLTQLDIGIALSYLKIAGEKFGKEFKLDRQTEMPELKGYYSVGVVC